MIDVWNIQMIGLLILFVQFTITNQDFNLYIRINDLSLSYKKLFTEKEDNLNIIKNAINSDDPALELNLSLKIEQLLEEAIKYNNCYKSTLSTASYENIKFSEDKNLKTEETKEKINKSTTKEVGENINIQNSSKENDCKKEELNDNNS